MEAGDGLALGDIRHTHLRFGELDLYQWCLFVAEHEKRHISQLRELAAQLASASSSDVRRITSPLGGSTP